LQLFQIKAVIEYQIILETMSQFPQKLSNKLSNDDNKTCFLSTKSAYYNDFWKIMWHWNWSNDAEISALPSQE